MASMAPIPMCPGAYATLADESGNQRAAIIALARLARTVDLSEVGELLPIILDGLQWVETVHERGELCGGCVVKCPAAVELEGRSWRA